MNNLIAHTQIVNGKFQSYADKVVREYIKEHDGDFITIELRLYKKRSLEQNKYLHLAFQILTDGINEHGNNYQMSEVKEMVKAKFLTKEMWDESTGELIGKYVKGTSECTTSEIADFIAQMRSWSMETLNIYIPEPNENFELDINNGNYIH